MPDPRHRYLINLLRLDDTHTFANVVELTTPQGVHADIQSDALTAGPMEPTPILDSLLTCSDRL